MPLSRHILLNTKHNFVFKEGLYINCDRATLIESRNNKIKKDSTETKSKDNKEIKPLNT